MPLGTISRLLAAGGLALSLGGCALMPHHARWAAVTPVKPHQPAVAGSEGYYQDAARAIERRQYGRALELLQLARERKADDVRVLNAFGVVYDKLGRFDLSARYYLEAKALDPNSAIVASNMAYSSMLQGQVLAPTAATALAHAPAPTFEAPASQVASAAASGAAAPAAQPARGRVVALGGGVVRLEPGMSGSGPVIVLAARSPALTGRPLAVINASGRPGAAEPVRLQLVSLGWSAPRSAAAEGRFQAHSVIRYAEADLPAARALARTLPANVRLVSCGEECDGVQLIVGADVARWDLGARRKPA